MFNNDGYATRGYLNLDPYIRGMVFNLLNERIRREEEIDYLQVFEFEKEENGVRVVHRQEIPPLEDTYHFVLDTNQVSLPKENVWVLDSGCCHTFMLPSEY